MQYLNDRKILEVSGIDTINFLQNLITNDLSKIKKKKIIHTFLLNNKGKILFEFYIHDVNDRVLIDVNEQSVDDLLSHLISYKLRSKININIKNEYAVFWSDNNTKYTSDPRNARIGLRGIEPKKQISSEDCMNNFDNIRIFESIAELNKDFKSEDVFPHELDSYMNSISNEKGCYPGQEIVSRVYHNKVISKKKFMRLAYTGSPKSQGAKLFQDKKEVGFLGSNANGFCLAYTNREFASNRYEVKHDELINISA